jgi:hypothetical protein
MHSKALAKYLFSTCYTPVCDWIGIQNTTNALPLLTTPQWMAIRKDVMLVSIIRDLPELAWTCKTFCEGLFTRNKAHGTSLGMSFESQVSCPRPILLWYIMDCNPVQDQKTRYLVQHWQ